MNMTLGRLTASALCYSISLALPVRADSAYRQVNLVSDQPGVARRTDTDLVNPWGLTIRPGGRILVVNNATDTAKLYSPSGRPSKPVISTPGAPTGVVQNFGRDFIITAGARSLPARVIFVTEGGLIGAWNPDLSRTNAFTVVDNSASNAVYKGVTRGRVNGSEFIYAANFRAGAVEMYDSHFRFVRSFTDATIPAGFAPFNVRNIRDELFVTYAKQLAPDNEDDDAGPGNGFVDVFDLEGNLLRRFASQGTLNSPWGIARAPSRFGRFRNTILVGNFGDGRINAFDPATGDFLGQLRTRAGNVIEIDGLWGLTFGARLFAVVVPFFGCCDVILIERPVLYFTAGPEDETHGLFGYVRPTFSFIH